MRSLPPEIVEMNKLLKRDYGNLKGSELPLYRISWAPDQLEKRFGEFEDRTPEGFLIRRVEEVREVKKYGYIGDRWILERLVEVPQFFETQLLDELSYECIWVFTDRNNQPVEPIYRAVDLVIKMLHIQMAKTVGAKYKDPEVVEPHLAAEARKAKIEKLTQELFGNETDVTDALHVKDAIVVPNNYEKGVN